MWTVIKAILLKLGLLRGLIAVLGSLAALLPIAIALLKLVGWPLVAVLLVLALPLLLILALVGFPFIAVLAIGGVVLGMVFTIVTFGLMVLKVVAFVALPIWAAWKLAKWAFRRGGGGERREASEGATP